MAFNNQAANTLTITIQTNVQGGQQVSILNNQLVSLKNTTRGITDAFHSLAMAYGAWRTLTSTIHSIESIARLAGDFDKLQLAMNQFSPTAEVAGERMAWLSELGQKAYGIRDMTKAFVELSTAGIKPTEREMAGLASYLMSVGKTSSYSLHEATQKLAQLYQTMNLGMDDSLKELTRSLPFAVSALMKELDKSYGEIEAMFKGKKIDFPTITNSIFKYLERNYAGEIDKYIHSYDALINRLGAKKELFQKTLMDQGLYSGITRWLEDIIDQLDRLARQGQFDEWARRVAAAVAEIGRAFGLADLDVKTVGDRIVKFIESVGSGSPALENFIAVVKNMAVATNELLAVIAKVPGSEYGILGTLLFGWKAGVVIGALGIAGTLFSKASKDASVAGTNGPESNFNVATAFGSGYGSNDLSDYTLWQNGFWGGGRGGRFDTRSWMQEKQNIQMVQDAVRESTQGYLDLIKLTEERNKQVEECIDKARGGPGTPEGVNLPGVTAPLTSANALSKQGETLLKQMVKQGETSGLEGFELYQMQMLEKLEEWTEIFNKRMAALQEYKRAAAGSIRETEYADRLIQEALEEDAKMKESFGKAVSGAEKKYSMNEVEKWTFSKHGGTLLKQMVKQGETSELEGFELYQAQMLEKLKEWNEIFDKRMAALQEYKRVAENSIGGTEYADKLIQEALEEDAKLKESFGKAVSGAQTKYSMKEGEKWARNIINVEDIDQTIGSIKTAMGVMDKSLDEVKAGLQQKVYEAFGDPLKAEYARIDRETETFLNEYSLKFKRARRTFEELMEKVQKSGKHPTPEATKAVLDIADLIDRYENEVLPEATKKALEKAAWEKRIHADQLTVDRNTSFLQQMANYAVLTGDMREQALINAQLIRQEGEKQAIDRWRAGALPQELDLIRQIAAERARLQELWGSNDFFGGLKEGIAEVRREFQTLSRYGEQFARDLNSSMQSEWKGFFDKVFSGDLTNAEEAWKTFMQVFQNAFSDALSNMLSKWITSGLMDIFGSVFGNLFGSSSGNLTSAGGVTWNRTMNIPFHHTGGIIGIDSGVLRAGINPLVFSGAPRFHSGLAPDEYPAILQGGEEVVSKGDRATILSELRANRQAGKENTGKQAQSVQVNIKHEGMSPIEAKSTGARFDGRRWVLDIITTDFAQGGTMWKMIRGNKK